MANLTTMLKAIHKKAMEGVLAILKDAAEAGGCRLSGDRCFVCWSLAEKRTCFQSQNRGSYSYRGMHRLVHRLSSLDEVLPPVCRCGAYFKGDAKERFMASHVCDRNHVRSSGSMEQKAAVMVEKRVSKTVFYSRSSVEIAVFLAVISFNAGPHGISLVFKNLGLSWTNINQKRSD